MPRPRERKNLFGFVLHNCLHGDRTPYAIRRDDGLLDSSLDPAAFFDPLRTTIERKAFAHVKGTVLDVGCGAGRHALYFQERGHEVVGIDNDALCVKTCRERGVETVLHEDILKPKRLKKYRFATVWLGGNNLGVIGSIRNLPRMLRIFAAVTTPKATVIATGTETFRATNPVHLAYHERQRKAGRFPGEVKIRIEYKGFVSPWFSWVHVPSKELKDAADKTGWRIGKLIRERDGRYVAVLLKAQRD